MHIKYLVPRAQQPGGIQQFARDAADSISQTHAVDLIDLGTSRLVQRVRLVLESARHIAGRASRYDIVHHWHIASAALPTLPADVVTCHGNELLGARWHTKAKTALKRSRLVMCNSSYTANIVRQQFDVPAERIAVMPPAVSRAALEAGGRAQRVRDDRPLQIGFLARLVPRKNAVRVIDAVQLLHERHNIELFLHLAGDGPEQESVLRRLADSGVPYRYWGAVDDTAKFAEFYPRLDIFVSPSLELGTDVEGFGISYLEANAFGVPVIAARTGGSSEAVKDGVSGLFVDPEDVESIALGIRTLATDRRHLEETSRAWAHEFEPRRVGEHLEALYQQLKTRRGEPPRDGMYR
jgi:phosphatidylinositol alpha-1,6-mannosyltransferase